MQRLALGQGECQSWRSFPSIPARQVDAACGESTLTHGGIPEDIATPEVRVERIRSTRIGVRFA